MRSLFTPSRIVVLVITFSLLSFLWTYGLPRQLAEPSLPLIQHPADEVKLHDPIAPAPVSNTPLATPTPRPSSKLIVDRPKEGDHRWDDDDTKNQTHVEHQTFLSGPQKTGAASHTDDGGRWNDKEKTGESGKATSPPASSATLEPVNPASSANTTIATASPTSFTPYEHTAATVKGFCKDVKRAQDVMVVVKTSKAEIFDKLSGHLSGILSCVPNFAIFSDHAGKIDGIEVHDALRHISSETLDKYAEFKEYKIIKEDPEYKPDAKKTKELDKWKILTMVYDAYKMNPHARFYAFIEADTGLSWTNLLQWVDRLDYRIPYYSGAQSFINHVQFAQRGPGILLSQGALRQYARSYEERWANKWEKQISKECCGDYMLATALNDAHVELYTSWPLMQGEQPTTLDYTLKQWCAPAVSWHHVDNEALAKDWDLQTKWTKKNGWARPYLYRDAYEDYVRPHLKALVEDWDNMSSDTKILASDAKKKGETGDDARLAKEKLEKAADSPPRRRDAKTDDKKDNKKAMKSEDKKKDDKKTDWAKINSMITNSADSALNCEKICTEVDDCLQWRYTPKDGGECHLSKVIKLGKAVQKGEGVQQWTSGWMVERIKETTGKWVCKEVNWKFYQ